MLMHGCFDITRGRGKRRKTIRETINKDLEINELDRNMVCDRTLWRCLIHVADPTKMRLDCCCIVALTKYFSFLFTKMTHFFCF